MKRKHLLAILFCSLTVLWSFLVIALWAYSKPSVSYESKFNDVITLSFPAGTPFKTHHHYSNPIDKHLRANAIGFFSGVLGGDKGIDFISIDTDFELVDERALVKKWIDDKIIPEGIEAAFNRGVYVAD